MLNFELNRRIHNSPQATAKEGLLNFELNRRIHNSQTFAWELAIKGSKETMSRADAQFFTNFATREFQWQGFREHILLSDDQKITDSVSALKLTKTFNVEDDDEGAEQREEYDKLNDKWLKVFADQLSVDLGLEAEGEFGKFDGLTKENRLKIFEEAL
jgi:hypothetical protein